MIRLCFGPKNMSLQVSTSPPFSAAARSISLPSPPARRQSGTTSPCTRSRATPPSGKMLKRRCVTASLLVDVEEVLAVALQRRCAAGSRAIRAPSSSSTGASARIDVAFDRARLRIVAAEERRVDDDAAHDAAARRDG